LDLPQKAQQTIRVLELYRTPLRLVASTSHPLARTSRLSAVDLSNFPSVALEANWYPTSAAHLRAHGLWSDPRRLNHHKSPHWEGRTADGTTLAYASPLTVERNPALCSLDFDLGLEQSLGLVVLKEHAGHPRIQDLHHELRARVATLQQKPAMATCAA
jgi:DNA-binding transcriptional LysR family regulator